MAIINNSSELVINTYASKEIFDTLKEQGKIKDNELHLIEGDDIAFDDAPAKDSNNLVNSGVVYKSIEEAKKEIANKGYLTLDALPKYGGETE